MNASRVWVVCCAVVGLLTTTASAASFQPIPRTSSDMNWPQAISADGTTVVGFNMTDPGTSRTRAAFMYRGGALTYLNVGGSYAVAQDVSSNGSVIVGYRVVEGYPTTTADAFRWENGATQLLPHVPGATDNLNFAVAWSVSPDGSIIAGQDRGGRSAFCWQAGQTTLLPSLAGTNEIAKAYDLSSDGRTIVGASADQPVIWRDGVCSGLPLLPGSTSGSARNVSIDGSIVAGTVYTADSYLASRWEGGVTSSLGFLASNVKGASSVHGMSPDGTFIVGYSSSNDDQGAFIWDAEHGMRSVYHILRSDFGIELAGWKLRAANAVSADGLTIVGNGLNPQGLTQGWIVRLPEPTTLSLLALGACVGLRRKHAK